MTNLNSTDTSTTIRNQLLRLARESGRPYNELLQYYAMERFLFRLSQTEYRSQFILKGALLFHIWKIHDSRATRDIDMLAFAENSCEHMESIVCDICEQNVDCLDGIIFDSQTVFAGVMQANREYMGIRVSFNP